MTKLLEDVDGALEKVRSLGVQGSDQLPERLSDEEKQQTAEAIENLSVEIYTGAEDRILRRMVIALGLKAPEGTTGGAQSADVRFDLQLLDVNEDQEIQAPENAKSFDDLVKQLDELGITEGLGSLGGLGGGRRRRGRRRREPAEPREVRRVHPRSRRRQGQGPQVRGPAADPVAADTA